VDLIEPKPIIPDPFVEDDLPPNNPLQLNPSPSNVNPSASSSERRAARAARYSVSLSGIGDPPTEFPNPPVFVQPSHSALLNPPAQEKENKPEAKLPKPPDTVTPSLSVAVLVIQPNLVVELDFNGDDRL